MIQDFLADYPDHLKGLLGSDRVHEHVTMDSNEMLGIQHAVLILEQAYTCQSPLSKNCKRGTQVPELLPGQQYQRSPSHIPALCT